MRPSFQSKVSRWLALAAILIAAPSSAQTQIRPGFNFFAYLERQSSQRPSLFERFLSDHPPPANRASRVRREAQLVGAIPRSAPVGDLLEAQTWLRRLPPALTLAQVTAGD